MLSGSWLAASVALAGLQFALPGLREAPSIVLKSMNESFPFAVRAIFADRILTGAIAFSTGLFLVGLLLRLVRWRRAGRGLIVAATAAPLLLTLVLALGIAQARGLAYGEASACRCPKDLEPLFRGDGCGCAADGRVVLVLERDPSHDRRIRFTWSGAVLASMEIDALDGAAPHRICTFDPPCAWDEIATCPRRCVP
jgi:hypothetical protein